MDTNTNFYLAQEESNKACLLAMRAIVLSYAEMTETKKYGMPCFCYKGKICCYIWIDKKTNDPYFLMAAGRELHHPALEEGDRKRMKILRINANEDLPVAIIDAVMNEAFKLCDVKK